MKRIVTCIVPTAVCLVFALAVTARAEDKKADPTGTWTWSVPGRNGGPARQVTAKLKFDGDKLTGSISGRQSDTAIEEGKLAGEDISFTVTREVNGTKIVQKFAGKLSGDSIKGKIDTDRDGQTSSADWEAKRGVAKATEPAPKPATP